MDLVKEVTRKGLGQDIANVPARRGRQRTRSGKIGGIVATSTYSSTSYKVKERARHMKA